MRARLGEGGPACHPPLGCWRCRAAGVDHGRMPPDLGCYQERYRLTGGVLLGLAASLLSVVLGLVWGRRWCSL